MDKIVLMTDKTEKESYLLQCLNMLFPDCEVEVKQRQQEPPFDHSKGTEDDNNHLIIDETTDKPISIL